MDQIIPKTKKDWLVFLKNTGLIILGTFILAFGTRLFIFQFDLVTGGVSGLGIILDKALDKVPWLGSLEADVYASAVNWVLFIIGLIFLGKLFAFNTLISTAVYPIALWVSKLIIEAPMLAEFFDLQAEGVPDYAIIVATIFGGACVGAGCAFTFLGGGSTGGVDVIALMLVKYVKGFKGSHAFFICDTAIVIGGMFAVKNFTLSLLGIIAALICAVSIDKLFLGESSAFIAHIVSDKYEEINKAVIEKMNRTTTIVDAVGGYSGSEKKMVIVTFSMRQYADFTALISKTDKNAFVTVHRAHEINGEGWTYQK